MIYGHNKVRTMHRSILPSTARVAARKDKRALIHHNRRPIRAALNSYYGDWDDYEADLTYWEGPNRADYGEIIRNRRDHDKLAHFEMWAYQRTKHLRREDRLSKISGMLPKGVIGDHALSHLSFLEPPNPRYYFDRRVHIPEGLPSRLRRNYARTLIAARVKEPLPGEVVEVPWLGRYSPEVSTSGS